MEREEIADKATSQISPLPQYFDIQPHSVA